MRSASSGGAIERPSVMNRTCCGKISPPQEGSMSASRKPHLSLRDPVGDDRAQYSPSSMSGAGSSRWHGCRSSELAATSLAPPGYRLDRRRSARRRRFWRIEAGDAEVFDLALDHGGERPTRRTPARIRAHAVERWIVSAGRVAPGVPSAGAARRIERRDADIDAGAERLPCVRLPTARSRIHARSVRGRLARIHPAARDPTLDHIRIREVEKQRRDPRTPLKKRHVDVGRSVNDDQAIEQRASFRAPRCRLSAVAISRPSGSRRVLARREHPNDLRSRYPHWFLEPEGRTTMQRSIVCRRRPGNPRPSASGTPYQAADGVDHLQMSEPLAGDGESPLERSRLDRRGRAPPPGGGGAPSLTILERTDRSRLQFLERQTVAMPPPGPIPKDPACKCAGAIEWSLRIALVGSTRAGADAIADLERVGRGRRDSLPLGRGHMYREDLWLRSRRRSPDDEPRWRSFDDSQLRTRVRAKDEPALIGSPRPTQISAPSCRASISRRIS